jgi:hypothetical protein
MKTYSRSRSIAPSILKVGTEGEEMFNSTLQSLYIRESVTIEQEAWLVSEPLWTFWRR